MIAISSNSDHHWCTERHMLKVGVAREIHTKLSCQLVLTTVLTTKAFANYKNMKYTAEMFIVIASSHQC